MIWYLIWPSSHLFWCFHGNLWAYGPPSFWRKNYFFALVKLFCPLVLFCVFGVYLGDDTCTAFTTGPAYKREPRNPNILSSQFHIKERSDLKTTDICQRQRYFYLFERLSFGTTAKPNPVHRGVWCRYEGKGGLFCRLGWGVPYPPRPRAPTGRRDRGVTKSSIPEPPSLPPYLQPLAKLLSLVWGITTRRGCCAETMRNIWF